MEFVVIDFETGNLEQKHSAIEIGLARFVDGALVASFSSLIKPAAGVAIASGAVKKHGLTRAHLKDAPNFADVYEDILAFIGDSILVAHNASFDLGVLTATAGVHGLNAPTRFRYVCTQNLSRTVLGMPKYSLADVCDFFSITNSHAHRALSDAVATGNCLLGILDHSESQLMTHVKAMDTSSVLRESLLVQGKRPSGLPERALGKREAAARAKVISAETQGKPQPLAGKTVVLSGTFKNFGKVEGQELIMAAGGRTKNSVSKGLHLLVCSDLSKPTAKHQEVIAFNERGANIEIIDEAEFLRRIG